MCTLFNIPDYSSDTTDNSVSTFETASLPSTALIALRPSLIAQTDASPMKHKTEIILHRKYNPCNFRIIITILQIYN